MYKPNKIAKRSASEKRISDAEKLKKCLSIQQEVIKGILSLYAKNIPSTNLIDSKNFSADTFLKPRPQTLQVTPSPYLTSKLCISSSKIGMLEKSLEPKTSKKPIKPLEKNSASIFKSRLRLNSSTLDIKSLKILKPLRPIDMWKMQQKININAKIFIIHGNYPDLRTALLKRGWVENPNSSSAFFDLKWSRSARVPSNISETQLYNHFPRNIQLTAKWNLCKNLNKQLKSGAKSSLFYFPRCFKLTDRGFREFNEYYKINYAISLLKDSAKEPYKNHFEKVASAVSISRQWINALKSFYSDDSNSSNAIDGLEDSSFILNNDWRILSSTDFRTIGTYYARYYKGENIQDLCQAANEELSQVDPQYFINGTKNIWIVKPGQKSRGRNISIHSCIREIYNYTNSSELYIVQKYIENPLLIHSKKFDIRQWVLVSNCNPLTIWVFKQSYLRFTIGDYTEADLSNLFAHLTNNSISKQSKNFNCAEIKGCMWSVESFKSFLQEGYGYDVWTQKIFEDIKRIVKRSMLAVGGLGRKNSFEIFGYDLMVDANLNTWLIEINSSPAMDYSTSITEALVKKLFEDALKVLLDYSINPLADTGEFELVYIGKKTQEC